jgi:nicotinamidase-related amidase
MSYKEEHPMQTASLPKTALVLVDIQNDYFAGGKNELHGSLEAGEQAGRLLEYFRRRHRDIAYIQHISTRPGAKFFLPDTPGVEIHPSVQPMADETIIQKHYPNSFRETVLLEHLHAIQATRLVIAGMMTHMCVEATTRAAFDLGFECLVAADACATKDLSFQDQTVPARHVHAAFLAGLQGTYAKVLTVDEVTSLLGL